MALGAPSADFELAYEVLGVPDDAEAPSREEPFKPKEVPASGAPGDDFAPAYEEPGVPDVGAAFPEEDPARETATTCLIGNAYLRAKAKSRSSCAGTPITAPSP